MTTTTDTAEIEALMRQQLDGTFTRLTGDGRIVTVAVPHDYAPKHGAGNTVCGPGRGISRQKSRRWTPEEDAGLLERRRRGMTLTAIAEDLGRTDESVRKRAQTLYAWMIKHKWEGMTR